MSLKYATVSEPLHISVKWLSVRLSVWGWECGIGTGYRVGERTASGARGGPEEVGPDKLEVVLVDLLPLHGLERGHASPHGVLRIVRSP
jgi:hypothetical protein